MSDIIRDFKSFTAQQINKQIQAIKAGESRREWLTYLFGFFAKGNQRNRTFQFWQSANHPIEFYHIVRKVHIEHIVLIFKANYTRQN